MGTDQGGNRQSEIMQRPKPVLQEQSKGRVILNAVGGAEGLELDD